VIPMRVLLISANQERSPDPVAPLGVCYVATAAADAGHEVQVLDLCFSDDVEGDVGTAVETHHPQAIGLSLRLFAGQSGLCNTHRDQRLRSYNHFIQQRSDCRTDGRGYDEQPKLAHRPSADEHRGSDTAGRVDRSVGHRNSH